MAVKVYVKLVGNAGIETLEELDIAAANFVSLSNSGNSIILTSSLEGSRAVVATFGVDQVVGAVLQT